MTNGEVVDADECDHDRKLTATDHDEAPTGAVVCADCGTMLEDGNAD